ncbi:Uu.00g089940.m01.CDS01 [Anthostomella pinea]|uniref:Uu.00g089940.m01.CDS01 n=1 Tax=Anthostomella pinea TaxID=933095 RepID=A0AAI8VHC9_9PEZI|nr:Uu.00g089940.m01.CDS01 [Anthostomella pinea]
MDYPCLPFTTRALGARGTPRDAHQASDFTALLPASHRTEADHIVAPQADSDFLKVELLVKRLNAVQDWLWVCGRPMPPRPLHHQVLINRDITITENPELHLVWHKHRIFLKPIPSWLLEPDVWTERILPNPELARCARGFLFSYTALIAYESDFRMAKEKGLFPLEVNWENWKQLSREILSNHCYATVNPRYWYGELRLSRLNKVYRLRKGWLLRGYSKVAAHTVYVDLIRDNFGALATILGYVVIVLTAMQVGLGTDRLQSDGAFQSVSYGFTVFSIIAPLVAGVGIIIGVLAMFVSNWIVTKDYEGKRFREMGVEPYWRNEPGKAIAVSSIKDSSQGSDGHGGGV